MLVSDPFHEGKPSNEFSCPVNMGRYEFWILYTQAHHVL